jgi:tetratricopeptide (TPR) repeat protein
MKWPLEIGAERRDRAAAVVLATSFVALLLLTRTLTRSYRTHETELARRFAERGAAALQAGRPEEAVAAYRDSIFYARNDRDSRFRLAQALLAAGHRPEARPYLETLWQEDPSLGVVNLELARMEAADNDTEAAVRHYHGAVYGLWHARAEEQRHRANRELVDYLKRSGDPRRAGAELLAFTSTLDDEDARGHADAGALFLELGEPGLALASFRQALRAERGDVPSLSGAGLAAAALGDWRTARDYLRRIPPSSRGEDLRRRLEVAEAVVSLDPWAPRLSHGERGRRTRAIVGAVQQRLEACAGSTTAAAAALSPSRSALAGALRAISPAALRRDPDAIHGALDVAAAAVARTDPLCEASDPRDEAVAVLMRARRLHEDADRG